VAHQQIMRAMALAGHRGDALRQYADCRLHLMSELQIEPSRSTTILYEQIRDGTFPKVLHDGPTSQALLDNPSYQARTASPSQKRIEMPSMQAAEFALDI
jgi:DNA-binding SARP family transcriptional activator